MTDKPSDIRQDVWDAAEVAYDRLYASGPITTDMFEIEAKQILCEAILTAKSEEHAWVVELTATLIRIALRDRHYRVVKPKEDGGIRGVGGMIATHLLTGVNGSFIGDKAILDMHPEAEAVLAESHPEIVAAIRSRGEG